MDDMGYGVVVAFSMCCTVLRILFQPCASLIIFAQVPVEASVRGTWSQPSSAVPSWQEPIVLLVTRTLTYI